MIATVLPLAPPYAEAIVAEVTPSPPQLAETSFPLILVVANLGLCVLEACVHAFAIIYRTRGSHSTIRAFTPVPSGHEQTEYTLAHLGVIL